MKITFLIVACFFITSAFAQGKRIDSFAASNGITYHEGDTIKLGRGSLPSGNFKDINVGGITAASDGTPMGRNYSGLNVILKKIKTYRFKGADKIIFIVGGGTISNYNLFIEDAIADCEVMTCNNEALQHPAEDVYDKIKKLKGLLDSGAITQKEYDEQKTKLLNQN